MSSDAMKHLCSRILPVLVLMFPANDGARAEETWQFYDTITEYGRSIAKTFVAKAQIQTQDRHLVDWERRAIDTYVGGLFIAPEEQRRVRPSILEATVALPGLVTLRGSGMPGSQITIRSGGRIVGSTRVPRSGSWHVRIGNALASGDHSFEPVARLEENQPAVRGKAIRIAVPINFSDHARVRRAPPYVTDRARQPTQSARRIAQGSELGIGRSGTHANSALQEGPLFDWLRRSSQAYQGIIVSELTRGASVSPLLPATSDGETWAGNKELEGEETAKDTSQTITELFDGGYSYLVTQTYEWLARARHSYRTEVAGELVAGLPRSPADGPSKPAEQQQARPDAPVPDDGHRETAAAPVDGRRPEDIIRQARQKFLMERELARQAAAKAKLEEQKKERRTAETQIRERRQTDGRTNEKVESKTGAAGARERETEVRKQSPARQAPQRPRAAREEVTGPGDGEKTSQTADDMQARNEHLRQADIRRRAEELAAAANRRADEEFAKHGWSRGQQTPDQASGTKNDTGDGKREAVAQPQEEHPTDDTATRVQRSAPSRRLSLKDVPAEEGSAEGDDLGDPPQAVKKSKPENRYARVKSRKAAANTSAKQRRSGKRTKSWRKQRKGKRRVAHRRSAKKRASRGRYANHRGHTYTIRRGDTLWGIAQRFYRAGHRYPRIFRANLKTISNPHLIYPRQRIFIPRLR